MGAFGPLDQPKLREIDEHLDARDLDQAAALLATLDDVALFRHAVSYLATRLLFLRGRLDIDGVVQRLVEVLREVESFPEAQAMLDAAHSGELAEFGTARKLRAAKQARRSHAPDQQPSEHAHHALASATVVPPEESSTALGADEPDIDSNPIVDDLSVGRESAAPDQAAPAAQGPAFPASEPGWLMESPREEPPPPKLDADAPVRPPLAPSASGRDPTAAARPSYDPTQSKSQLPPHAGLYSAEPSETVVEQRRPSAPVDAGGSARGARGAVSWPEAEPARVRSVPPPALGPSLFELASWLDAGDPQRVVDAVEARSASPTLQLMRCRALVATGALPSAREALSALGATPLLEPELRGAVARLLLELGNPEEALAQAARATSDDPSAAGARVALAWSLVRLERRTADPELLTRASDALAPLSTRGNPYTGLVLALRACVQAGVGEPDKAIAVAQRALGVDADSVDASAALALAAARLGHLHDAQRAWCRVLDLDHVEADALSERLVALGVDLQQALPGAAPPAEAADPIWDDVERHLAGGGSSGLCELERHAQRHIERATANQRTELQVLAALSAGYLNTAPCFRNFAPFDLSLRSIRQLEAALLASYGTQPRPDLSTDHWALTLTLGSYLGEVLRQVHAGRWTGSLGDAVHARVLARAGTWEPLRLIQARLLGGSSHDLTLALRSAFPPEISSEWERRVPIAVLPATPWAGDWPSAAEAQGLGSALKASLISSYLERLGVGALDGSYADFARLDRYLELLAPARAASVRDDATRRACGLVGCHVGEVVRAEFGGQWVDQALALSAEAAAGPQRTALVLGDGRTLEPLKILADRLGLDRKFSLQEWHQTLSLAH